MTNMEKIVHKMVKDLCAIPHEGTRHEIAMLAAKRLDAECGVNCARDDIKAGDYLSEALDKYLLV